MQSPTVEEMDKMVTALRANPQLGVVTITGNTPLGWTTPADFTLLHPYSIEKNGSDETVWAMSCTGTSLGAKIDWSKVTSMEIL